jgi:predicted Holliday junction resolvase-like endonuclease
MSQRIIKQLTSIPGLKIQCPNSDCNQEFGIKRAKLFGMYEKYPQAADQIIIQRCAAAREMLTDVKARMAALEQSKAKKPERITVGTQATNFGQICEQIVPAFVNFPYIQAESRVMFNPIDYVVFPGLANYGRVESIRFVEFKTGAARLSKEQRQIRDCISEGNVKHRVIA